MPKTGKGSRKAAAAKKNTTKKNNNTTKKNNKINLSKMAMNNQGVKNASWADMIMADEMGLTGAERKKYLEEGVQMDKRLSATRALRNKKRANQEKALKNYLESVKNISPVYPPWWTPPSSNNNNNNKKSEKQHREKSRNERIAEAVAEEKEKYFKHGKLQKRSTKCKHHCSGRSCWANMGQACPYLHMRNGKWEEANTTTANTSRKAYGRSSGKPPRPTRRRNNTRKNY